MLAIIWLAALRRFIGAFISMPPLAHRLDFPNYGCAPAPLLSHGELSPLATAHTPMA
jgi:hypothetical protein